MSDNNPLHDLLSEMVQAYSQKNQAPHIPTPAEIGTHLHPLLDRMCVEAENRKASDIFISAGFPPSMKVSGVLTPVPHKALTAEETAQIVESTMNPEQLEAFKARALEAESPVELDAIITQIFTYRDGQCRRLEQLLAGLHGQNAPSLRIKTIRRYDVLPQKRLSSAAEIEAYVEQLKQKLLQELAENDAIQMN